MPDFTTTRLRKTSSTNKYALRHLLSLPDRHIVRADIQTRGQGRLDRSWFSEIPGNIYASFILKPQHCPDGSLPLAALSQYLSVCICEVMDNYGISADLKWPNDILVNTKKIGGILGQSGFRGEYLEGIVLGTGINLNMDKSALSTISQPATSLNLLTETPVDSDLFLNRLAIKFFAGYDNFLEKGFPMIKKKYIRRSPYLGTRIRVILADREIIGKAVGFDDNGFLVMLDDSGRNHTVTAGDVLFSRAQS